MYNRSPERTELLVSEHPEAGFVATASIKEFAAALQKPRTAIVMVKAGKGTDAVIDQLTAVFEPGDIIVDGGNALFTDTIRRDKAVRETGINFVGAGISGGEEGALLGPSIMPGGSAQAYETLGPILASIAAVVDGEPCVTHVGTDGAGYFVKMIHNDIEYADMQLIAEAYDLLRSAAALSPAEIADVFSDWNTGELESYLIEITAEILRRVDAKTGKPFVDIMLEAAGSKGTGGLDRADRTRSGRSCFGHRRSRVRARRLVKAGAACRGIRPARPKHSVVGNGQNCIHRGCALRPVRLQDHRVLAGAGLLAARSRRSSAGWHPHRRVLLRTRPL
ncbi:6-phosphogluconate dehydrogenase, decarboxylating [Leifsonia rubra CMS 76R]|nr:6-phosphogluconate dehydrogenase, decarboxylating [Leifsonia rubra CMS 76R]